MADDCWEEGTQINSFSLDLIGKQKKTRGKGSTWSRRTEDTAD